MSIIYCSLISALTSSFIHYNSLDALQYNNQIQHNTISQLFLHCTLRHHHHENVLKNKQNIGAIQKKSEGKHFIKSAMIQRLCGETEHKTWADTAWNFHLSEP